MGPEFEEGMISRGIYLIDTEMVGFKRWTACYFVAGREKALIETGPASSARVILRKLERLGFSPRDVSYIIVTHIHLDHAGGAGALVRLMPKAKVLVHEVGAKHLEDPERLVAGSQKVLGEIVKEFGETLPVEGRVIQPLKDGDVVDLGESKRLRIVWAPGHAPHHLCLFNEGSGELFAGDAVGLHLPGVVDVLPAATPPNFDLETSVETIRKLEALNPSALLFTHYGGVRDVKQTLQLSIRKLRLWGDIIYGALRENSEISYVAEKLREQLKDELGPLRTFFGEKIFESYTIMAVHGYLNYFKKTGKF